MAEFVGFTVYSCTKPNYRVVRRAARQAERIAACDIRVTCDRFAADEKTLTVRFDCRTEAALEKSGDLLFGLLDRAKREKRLTVARGAEPMAGKRRH